MKRNVPKLRFNGFEDEWISDEIKNLFNVSAGGDISKEHLSEIPNDKFKYPVYANSLIKKGLHGFSDIYKFSGETITVTGRGVNIGVANARYNKYYPIVRLLVLNPKEKYNIKFFEEVINKTKIFIESTGVPQLTAPQISKIKTKYPSLPEQEKIANFLTKVDSLIEEQIGKVTDLEKYKKGMMQKIFSQKIRFKDDNGCEYPEWEEKKLDDVTTSLDNMRKPLNSSERENMKGSIPYYGANGIVDYVNNYIFNERLILLAEDGGNFDEFATRPIAQLIDGKSWVNNHAHVLKSKDSYVDFIFYILVHKDIRKYINGTSRAKLNKSDMLDIKIQLPCIEEQTKIANLLSNIDSIIEEEKGKLEDLRQWKKGLLQQMFV